ncbi:cytidine diphosphate-diacylglycerol synthase [Babesia caballi]|uniref:Phosphatidate cytidylyltransferase n=1 Tax=Babesia caballi TaxID=5871 RepID=A0AAV4LVS5_BABCB|nr:cytidine diphosphate-diacylglycerol synthase [Babesia caballi]
MCLGQTYVAILLLSLISVSYYELVGLYDKVVQQKRQTAGEDVGVKTTTAPEKNKKRVRLYVITQAFDLLSFISLETYLFVATIVGISFPWLLPRVARLHPKVARACAFILSYHNLLLFISFFSGIIKFILSLEKGHSSQQFLRLAFILMALFYVVIQSMMIIANLYYGLVWFALPHFMISVNDTAAYVFGKIYGKTPLISLSPNKTLEGFIGAFLLTSLIMAIGSPFFLSLRPMVCPVNNFDLTPFAWMGNKCELESVYKLTTYMLPHWVTKLTGLREIYYRPSFVHVMILTVFACLFAPFGGFFASGLKRALKVKDFGDTIPGHGGMMDRFDCHVLMGTFTYLYLKTFVRGSKYSVGAVMKVISRMRPEDRSLLLEKLKEVYG